MARLDRSNAMNPDIRNIVILTGAGISAESGLATFRGPDGLWEGHRVQDVCTPDALARDPVLVHRFYDERRARWRLILRMWRWLRSIAHGRASY